MTTSYEMNCRSKRRKTAMFGCELSETSTHIREGEMSMNKNLDSYYSAWWNLWHEPIIILIM